MRRRDHSLEELLVNSVGRQAANEAAIDLQVVDRQTLEVIEGRGAGAEVVESEGAAEFLQARGKLLGAGEIGDNGRFRHLDNQAPRVDRPRSQVMVDDRE